LIAKYHRGVAGRDTMLSVGAMSFVRVKFPASVPGLSVIRGNPAPFASPMRRRMRWQAIKASLALRPWQPDPAAFSGLAVEGTDAELREACRRLSVELAGEPVIGSFTRSLSAMVRAPDGAFRWLKVYGVREGVDHPNIEAEKSAAAIRGIRKPAILGICEWSGAGIRWHAFLMTLASPQAKAQPFYSRRRMAISDGWIAELRRALKAVAGLSTDRRRYTPERLRATIVQRFGAAAPHLADEWQTAHGDTNWSNLTAPELILLDWGLWGLAPRGFDAAWLIAFSSPDAALTRRLQEAFAEDLATPSGPVAQLAACADLLPLIEAGHLDPRFHAPIEALARRALQISAR
jgi:hypothetical protein